MSTMIARAWRIEAIWIPLKFCTNHNEYIQGFLYTHDTSSLLILDVKVYCLCTASLLHRSLVAEANDEIANVCDQGPRAADRHASLAGGRLEKRREMSFQIGPADGATHPIRYRQHGGRG